MGMEIERAIKILCAENELSISELARRMNMSPQALSQKIKRGTFSLDDLKTVAILTSTKFECTFEFADGTKIKL